MTGHSTALCSDDRTLGQHLHEARRASTVGRIPPWPVADWADRDERLKAVDEAMAAAVEAAVRGRIAVELRRLADDAAAQPVTVPGIERRTRRDTYLAAVQVALFGLAKRSDEKAAQP